MTKTKKSALTAIEVGAANVAETTYTTVANTKSKKAKHPVTTAAQAAEITAPPATKAPRLATKDKTAATAFSNSVPPTKPKDGKGVKGRTTKQEQVLAMLSKKGGASIDEVMAATGWQQHTVRGFLAGTVRKKLGLEVTSHKEEGRDRRYAIRAAA